MASYTALTTLPGRDPAEALGEALEATDPAPSGVGVFEMEDGSGLWEVGGYFDAAPDEAALAVLAAAHGARPFAVSELDDIDWVARVRRELRPVEAGRFHLYGSHDADTVPEERIALLIEASMAFGTGHHGTTLGCLRMLDAMADEGLRPARVADIGCGTAVLAMGAARLWPEAAIVAGDIDEVAVEVAEANLAANDLAGRMRVVTAAGFGHEALRAAAPYELIFANILKGPLVALAPEIAANTAPGGRVILSGLLNRQMEAVEVAYAEAGLDVEERLAIGEWTTLRLRRPK